jgi:Mg2+-importing ATPase
METRGRGIGETPGLAGLTSQEAAKRLQQGPNDPAPAHRSSAVRDFVRLFLNPLVLVLLIAASVSAFLGEPVDAAIVCSIVLLSTAIDFAQTYRSGEGLLVLAALASQLLASADLGRAAA